MVPSPLCSLTATQVLELYGNDTITVEQYARALLDRVKIRDGIVRAWAYLGPYEYYPEYVLSQARALDHLPRSERGPLHGVAVGLKDIIETKDMPTQLGCPLYKGFRPGTDASLASILRSAGAIIFGKTTTTELTVLNSGPNTTNPHDPNRTPGGSSAGSAAAVADLHVPISFGTQSGGSIIRPASYTGVFAMKPTINVISPEGIKLVSFGIDTPGFFARDMEDLQLIADVFTLRKFDSPRRDVGMLEQARIAVVKTPMWHMAGPSTIKASEKATRILESHGVKVEQVDLPSHFGDADALRLIHKTIMNVESEAAFLTEYRKDKSQIHPDIRGMVENEANFTLSDHARALDRYATMRAEFDKIADGYTAIVTPSAIDVAPLGLDDMGDSSLNFLWTGLHTPVIHIPAFTGADGMPVGLSIVSGRFRDRYLLNVAKELSEVLMAGGGWKVTNSSTSEKAQGAATGVRQSKC